MYQLFFQSVPVGLSINRMDGVFIIANDALLEMLGYTHDELMNLSYWEITPKEYAEKEQEQLELLQKSRTYGPYTKEYFHRQGHRINVLLNGVLLRDEEGAEYILSSVEDITHIEKSTQVLNKAQELGNIGHWHLDLLKNELSWSDETFRIFGLKPQSFEATYEAFVERIYPDDREAVNSAYTHSVSIDEPYQIEHRVIRPDGTIRFVIERCEHFHGKDGSIIGSIGTVLDITERKEIEEALIKEKEKAEAANQAKSVFIANVSHELRTPLNAILGFSNQLVSAENLSDAQKKNLSIINRSGMHLLDMINDILDLSKIESGQIQVENTSFDLLTMMQSLSDMMSSQAHEKGLVCDLNLTEGVPRFVRSDERKIKQILINLLGNAIKFTDKGTIRFTMASQKILNQASKVLVMFTLSDTGCGIEADMIEEVFQPFVQNDGVKKVEGGTGLGLSISRKLAQILGGTLWVESTLGKGSVFHLNIPVEIAGDELVSPESLLTKSFFDDSFSPPGVHNSDMKILPLVHRKAILDAAILGSGSTIRKELLVIEPDFPRISKELLLLIKQFDFEAIINLLKEEDA